jgi:hypothetical protein
MRVQWVHPTWRDLVIAQLAGDEAARRQFLHRCGVYGIELALSTAGGPSGASRLRLIACDADWDAVTDRLFALVLELEPTELLALLACLHEAIEDLRGSREGAEAQALARTTLARVATLWDAAGAPIPLVQLAAWLDVAGRLEPEPSPPRLSLTWVELLPASVPEPDDRAAVERFADWLTLCELLWDYNFELKAQLGHNDEHVELMASFVGRVELHKSLPRPEAEQVLRALELIAELEPDLQPLARFVGRDLRTAAAPPSGLAPDVPEPPPPELFEVQRVLADL